MELTVLAGTTSTIIFAASTLPMLLKAICTKDLGSYSLGNLLLSNLGNLIHSVYIFSLPFGPIWLLHSFYLVTTALMLIWYLRYEFESADQLERLRNGVIAEQVQDRLNLARLAVNSELAAIARQVFSFLNFRPKESRGYLRTSK